MRKNTKFNILHLGGAPTGHRPRRNQGGQVALVVLLVSAVTLMLGITASRKGTIDSSIGHDQELSAKAFSSAESGLEYTLSQLAAGNVKDQYSWSSGGASADVRLRKNGEDVSFYPVDAYQSGEPAFFWLRNPTNLSEVYTPQTIGVCWEEGNNQALAFHLFYEDGYGNYRVYRGAIDEDEVGDRRVVNGFSPPGNAATCRSGFDGSVFDFSSIGVGSQPVLLVVMPLYESTKLGVHSTSGDLPAQGYEITSTGTAANVSRALQMNYGWPVPPYYFVDGVFSGTDILGN